MEPGPLKHLYAEAASEPEMMIPKTLVRPLDYGGLQRFASRTRRRWVINEEDRVGDYLACAGTAVNLRPALFLKGSDLRREATRSRRRGCR